MANSIELHADTILQSLGVPLTAMTKEQLNQWLKSFFGRQLSLPYAGQRGRTSLTEALKEIAHVPFLGASDGRDGNGTSSSDGRAVNDSGAVSDDSAVEKGAAESSETAEKGDEAEEADDDHNDDDQAGSRSVGTENADNEQQSEWNRDYPSGAERADSSTGFQTGQEGASSTKSASLLASGAPSAVLSTQPVRQSIGALPAGDLTRPFILGNLETSSNILSSLVQQNGLDYAVTKRNFCSPHAKAR